MMRRAGYGGYCRVGPGTPQTYAGYAGQNGAGCGVEAFVNGPAVDPRGAGCAVAPPYCGCNVLGGNTLQDATGAAQAGLAAGACQTITIDSGDACRWQPRSILVSAYAASATVGQIDCVLGRVSGLITQVRIGSIPMIRRPGSATQQGFGIIIDGYSDNKELTCVDWSAFTSTNNQTLQIEVCNICDVAGTPNGVHFFVDLWGDNLAA